MENRQDLLRDSFNVTSEIKKEFGHWLVTSDGDVINYQYSYAIYSYHLDNDDWLAQLRMKTWFDQYEETGFLEAFGYACSIQGIKVNLIEDFD